MKSSNSFLSSMDRKNSSHDDSIGSINSSRQGNSQSAEVAFAQKATAIVRAAGLDPRAMDLETFRRLSPVIFTRAYCAIYNEQLPASFGEDKSLDGGESIGREDAILNSQIVIDALSARCSPSISASLAMINGVDIYNGQHRAIGLLVNALFAEGQRLWLEKSAAANKPSSVSDSAMQHTENHNSGSSVGPSSIASSVVSSTSTNRLNSKNDANRRPKSAGAINRGDPRLQLPLTRNANTASVGGLTDRSSVSNLETERSESHRGDDSHKVDDLLSRIEYLENRLRRRSTRKKRNESGSGDELSTARTPRTARSQRPRSAGGNSTTSRPSSLPKVPASGISGGGVIGEYVQDDINDDQSGDGVNDFSRGRLRRARPTSAGMTRRVKQVSSRLYPTPPPKEIENIAHTKRNKSDKERTGDEMSYTYDLSGRKIPVSVADAAAKRRQQEALEARKKDEEARRRAYEAEEAARNRPPVRPSYPGPRIEASATAFIKKQQVARLPDSARDPITGELLPAVAAALNGNSSANILNPPVVMPKPRSFLLYEQLESGDVVLSVEHCHKCDHHCMSLRHDESGYRRCANGALRWMAAAIAEAGICCRVGVARIPAAVTERSTVTDKDSRIGALEIQVASRGLNGGSVKKEVIHSKLTSRVWPSRNAVEKRLITFLASVGLPNYDRFSNNNDDDADDDDHTPCSYPVGRFDWSRSPLASESWVFNENVAVEWVFDTRRLAKSAPLRKPDRFPIGSTVWVSEIMANDGNIEPKPLLATVSRSLDASGQLQVTLRYFEKTVSVVESQLQEHHLYTCPKLRHPVEASMPTDLEAVFQLASIQKKLFWSADSSVGDIVGVDGTIALSRQSFFRQIHKIVWRIVSAAGGISHVRHPRTNAAVDVTAVYSEAGLDWLGDRFGEPLRVTEIEALAVPIENEAEANSTFLIPHPPVDPRSNTTSPVTCGRVTSVAEVELTDSRPQQNYNSNSNISAAEVSAIVALIRGAVISPIPHPDGSVFALSEALLSASDSDTDAIPIPEVIDLLRSFCLETLLDSSAAMDSLISFFSLSEGVLDGKKFAHAIRNHGEAFAGVFLTPRQAEIVASSQVAQGDTKSSNSPTSQNESDNKNNTELGSSPVDAMTVNPPVGVVAVTNTPLERTSTTKPFVPSLTIENPAGGSAPVSARLSISSVSAAQMPIVPKHTRPTQFSNRDLVISQVVLEGSALISRAYDNVALILNIQGCSNIALQPMKNEPGSKRRTFDVSWNEIGASINGFETQFVTAAIVIPNLDSAVSIAKESLDASVGASIITSQEAETRLTTFSTMTEDAAKSIFSELNASTTPVPCTPHGGIESAPHCAQLPQWLFMDSSFSVQFAVCIPVIPSPSQFASILSPLSTVSAAGTASSVSPIQDNVVIVTVYGNAREGRESRKTRIMSMTVKDLRSIKLAPVNLDIDDLIDESESDSDDGLSSPMRNLAVSP